MSYIDKNVLKSFYQENSFVVKQTDGFDITSIVPQIDEMIKSKTGLATPANTADANKVLQLIACRIFILLSAGKEGVTSEMWDFQRRKYLYESAMADLDKIVDGEITLYDSNGTAIVIPKSSTPESIFESTKRITGLL